MVKGAYTHKQTKNHHIKKRGVKKLVLKKSVDMTVV